MNPRLARLLSCLYPRRWRERYGEEFAAMLEMSRGNLRTVVDSIRSALSEHIFPTQRGNMDQATRTFGSILR